MRDKLPETISLPIWAWLSLGGLFCLLLYLLVTCNPFPLPVQNPTLTPTVSPTWTAIPPTTQVPPTHPPTRTLTPVPTQTEASTSTPTSPPTTAPTNTESPTLTPTLQETTTPTITPIPTVKAGCPTKLPTTGTDNASQQWLNMALFGLYVVLAGVLLRATSEHISY